MTVKKVSNEADFVDGIGENTVSGIGGAIPISGEENSIRSSHAEKNRAASRLILGNNNIVKKKNTKQKEYEYVRVSSSSCWATKKGLLFSRMGTDIDVTFDNKTWYHLYGYGCGDRLKNVESDTTQPAIDRPDSLNNQPTTKDE